MLELESAMVLDCMISFRYQYTKMSEENQSPEDSESDREWGRKAPHDEEVIVRTAEVLDLAVEHEVGAVCLYKPNVSSRLSPRSVGRIVDGREGRICWLLWQNVLVASAVSQRLAELALEGRH